MPAKKTARASGPREQIAPRGDKRYGRRTKAGAFTGDQADVGRSRATEARQAARGEKAKTAVKQGYGDRGDVKRRAK